MRRCLWVMATLQSHLIILCTHHVDVAEEKIKKCEFGVDYNGVTSPPNFSEIHLAILQSLTAYWRISCKQVRLGLVRLAMRMRKRSCIVASSSSHHATLSIHHVAKPIVKN